MALALATANFPTFLSAECSIFAAKHVVLATNTVFKGVCVLASCFHHEEERDSDADAVARPSWVKKQHGRVRASKETARKGHIHID